VEKERSFMNFAIELQNLSNFVLKQINLQIQKGEKIVLLGPNGAGKSTLLNVIAGFCEFSGSITFSGVAAGQLDPAKRRIGYVYQSNALFPHKTVYSNVSFGLEAAGATEQQARSKVTGLLEMLGISHLADRYPFSLSGGEAKKAALARALAVDPEILFLDEPFSGIDSESKTPLMRDFNRIISKLNLTVILVTHLLEEARFMGERLALMKSGHLIKTGTFWETFPAVLSSNSPERRETDFDNVLPRYTVLTAEKFFVNQNGLAEIHCHGLRLQVPYEGQPFSKVAIDSHAITLMRDSLPFPCMNLFAGIVKSAEKPCRGMALYVVDIGGVELTAVVQNDSREGKACGNCRCGGNAEKAVTEINQSDARNNNFFEVNDKIHVLMPVGGLHAIP
jgi:ABC-type nitrate/sulfonate/bicarbonate transport system ATPase subunit